MIYSTLRDQDWSFCCQVNGNIILSKCFDEMRLLRPLRSLRLLRFLMAENQPIAKMQVVSDLLRVENFNHEKYWYI